MKEINFYKVDLDSLGDREHLETVSVEGFSTKDLADLLINRRYEERDDVVFEIEENND